MEELTQAQLTQLRAQLLARREELQATLRSSEDGARPVDLGEPIGRLSRMDAMQQVEMTRANRSTQADELRRISTALADVDSGDYGFCRVCEEPIGYARLRAQPSTRICVDCQSKRENPPA